MRQNKKNIIKKPCPDISLLIKANCIAIDLRFLWEKKDGIIGETHPFSIASSPSEDKVRMYIKSLGDFTTSLKNLKVGAIAEIEGAYGKFTYTNFGTAPQIWIAGGIGVTPFLSMARSYDSLSPAVDFVYSVVSRTELLDHSAVAFCENGGITRVALGMDVRVRVFLGEVGRVLSTRQMLPREPSVNRL